MNERTQDISEIKPTMESVDEAEMMNPLLEYIDSNVIGRDTMFNGPYGSRQGMVNTVRYSAILIAMIFNNITALNY